MKDDPKIPTEKDPIKRLKYFTGQFLDESDFTAEQGHHVNQRRRANRMLWLGAGILDDGFQLQVKTGNPGRIVIGPGIGVDGKGRELVLVADLEWDLPLSAGWQYVTLRYDVKETDPQVQDQDVSDNTRYEEKPLVNFRANLGDFDNQIEIVVGRIQVDAQGHAIGSSDVTTRQIAKVRAPGDLVVGQGGSAVLRTRHINGKSVGKDGDDDLFLNWNNGKNVVLGFGDGSVSSLMVSGKLGIGTANPSCALEIRGPNSPIGAAGQRDIALSFDYAGSARIRGFRGDSWDTSLQLLTNSRERGIDNPEVRVHVDSSGHVGIGTTMPSALLSIVPPNEYQVDGSAHSSVLRVSGGVLGNVAGSKLTLSSTGFRTASGEGGTNNVSLGVHAYRDRVGQNWYSTRVGLCFDVDNVHQAGPGLWLKGADNDSDIPQDQRTPARVMVSGGALMPTAGNDDGCGILFPANPGGGSGDAAWIRYYARDPRPGVVGDYKERTALELGVGNDGFGPAQDDLILMPSGGVGIGTRETGNYRLMVSGGDTRIAAMDQEQSLFGLDKLVGFNDLRFYVDDVGVTEVMHLSSSGLQVNRRFDWAGDHTSSGYLVLGGLILCWGSLVMHLNDNGTSKWEVQQAVSFPVSFSAVPVVTVSISDPGIKRDVADTMAGSYNVSVSGFVALTKRVPLIGYDPKSGDVVFNWIAIGR